MLISYWGTWWAGDSYGPRFFTDMLPFLMYFLIPVVAALRRPTSVRDWALALAFGICVVISFGMHYVGGARGESWRWNIHPSVAMPSGNSAERMWDWSDPQFLRGIRPGALATAPDPLRFTARKGDTAAKAEFAVGNQGFSAFEWQFRVPRGVFSGPPCSPVYPFTYCVMTLALDTTGYDTGVHDVGSLYVTARRTGLWGSVTGSPQVIPVSVEVLP